MNGLCFIRKRCNFSLSELACEIGVSRQAISSWENGKKAIPQKRKEQLSRLFGIEERFLEEITEEDMSVLLQMALYRCGTGNKEKYSFKEKGKDYYYPDMPITLDEQLVNAKKRKTLLMERISASIDTVKENVGLYIYINNINRMCEFYESLCDLLEYKEGFFDNHKES